MDAIKRAEKWLKEPPPDNGEPEPYEISEARLVIDLLLSEIRCLKVQVADRGNSFKKQVARNEKLRKTLEEVSGCQTNHGTAKLCDGCLISICDALAE